MQPIVATIARNQIGSVAANFIECILFLISKDLLEIRKTGVKKNGVTEKRGQVLPFAFLEKGSLRLH